MLEKKILAEPTTRVNPALVYGFVNKLIIHGIDHEKMSKVIKLIWDMKGKSQPKDIKNSIGLFLISKDNFDVDDALELYNENKSKDE